MYKLWQSSWRDDAVKLSERSSTPIRSGPEQLTIATWANITMFLALTLPAVSLVRTPVILQAGTSKAGKEFGAKNADAIFVAGHNPSVVAKTF